MARVMFTTPPFDAQYTVMPGTPIKPASEAMFTILPLDSRKAAEALRTSRAAGHPAATNRC